MTKIQQQIADKMTQETLCSSCKLRDSCDRRPIQNAWRFDYTFCPKWEQWNERSTR